MKMIFYTGIQKNSNYLINILHCILIMTEMQHCNSIGIVFFFNINFCALVTIKLNVSLVYFFIWYMVLIFLPREKLSQLMSELGSGGRGEAFRGTQRLFSVKYLIGGVKIA